MSNWNIDRAVNQKQQKDIGFVYLTWTSNGYYVGCKHFDKKNKWLDYVGSSKLLQHHIEEGDAYQKFIMYYDHRKSHLRYIEMALQIHLGVLHDNTSYNKIINCRIADRHLTSNFKDALTDGLVYKILREINEIIRHGST